MSKRKSKSLTLTQSKRNLSYFAKILDEVGVNLNEDVIVLRKEQSLVIRDIGKSLASDGSHPDNLKEFTCDIEKYIKNKENFSKVLANTILKKPSGKDDGIEVKIAQESLFRILLNVDLVQSSIIEMILEEITGIVSDEDADNRWLRLLLNGLRYLSHIRDSKSLTTKLLDILEIAQYTCQIEILNSIPEILPDSHYDETAKQLSKLLESNTELTGAILDCLNSFSLSVDMRTEVQEYILNNLLTSCKNEVFPVLFEFLVTDCKSDSIQNVLMKCRGALDSLMGSESADKDLKSTKALVLNRLYSCAAIPKQHFEAWMSVISGIRVHSDHKPIDLLVLIVLFSTNSSRKKLIEALIKKRIKNNLFKVGLLDGLFKKYLISQFLIDYNTAMIEISLSLLRHHNDVNMVGFGSQIVKSLFCHKLTNRMQRQDVLHNLILLAGASEEKTVENVLVLLTELSKSEASKMSGHLMQLMGLLEKLDTYELPAVKQIFELLCGLTCSPNAEESASGLKDEIHMLVRKQLSSSKRAVKLRGIVAAVIMAKHVGTVLEDQTALSIAEESMMSISDIPQGPPQDAATLLELANTCSACSAEYMSVYYDQLASMIVTTENMEKHFLSWLFETITNDFQDVFVTENVPGPINDITISPQYSLNSSEEVDVAISVNIAEFTIRRGEPSILVLAPLFRLLRLLHYQHENGNLSSIDALLGCGVLMPIVANVNDYDIDQVKQVADCVFHCINWFREIVSAFVTQKNKKLRQKVINRLAHIIELEEVLKQCMEIIPEHKLPVSYFYDVANHPLNKSVSSPSKSSPRKSSPRPKKKLKSKAVVQLGDITSTCATINPQNKTVSKKVSRDLHFSFREIDIDIILLLKYSLKVDDEAPLAQSTQSGPQSGTQSATQSITTTINLKQFQFLMQDFITKLHVLTKNVSLGLSNLSVVNPVNLITDSIRLLPCINQHFYIISDCLSKMLIDDPENTDSIQALKESFNLVLECFALIFGWSGFQSPKHLPLLRDCLKSLRGDEATQSKSANRLIIEFAATLSAYSDQCLYLPSAVYLIKILEALHKINLSPEIQKTIISVSGKLLMVEWRTLRGSPESGKTFASNLETLANAYLDGASVKTICGLIGTLQTQIAELEAKDDRLQVLQSFEKSTYSILYKCICDSLLNRIKSEITSLTNSQHLTLWKTTALSMQGLMTIAKIHETRSILVCFLKKSLGILKVFLSQGIPILEIMLRSKTEEVLEIFKTMQTSTRFLHHLCCYSKLTKDSSLIALVPQFRLTLESLIYRVKGALIANDCSAAFWMGNLRNKNLHGEDICSQSSDTTEASSARNEEEVMPDDDSDTSVPAEDVDNEDTASEVFD